MAIIVGAARRVLDRRLGGAPAAGGPPLDDPGQREAVRQLGAEVEALRDELTGLRREMDEAQNRLDFTERLLAQARDRGLLSAPKER
jgi:hypothetical protein